MNTAVTFTVKQATAPSGGLFSQTHVIVLSQFFKRKKSYGLGAMHIKEITNHTN